MMTFNLKILLLDVRYIKFLKLPFSLCDLMGFEDSSFDFPFFTDSPSSINRRQRKIGKLIPFKTEAFTDNKLTYH